MALTLKQVEAVIDLFARAFANIEESNARKKTFIYFEDTFGKSINDWKELCRTRIKRYTSDEAILKDFDMFANRIKVKQIADEVIVRRMVKTDIDQVRELLNSAFQLHLTERDGDRFVDFINSGYSIVACNEEEILGVLLSYKVPDLNFDALYIDSYVVAEKMRNQGIGRKMMTFLVSLTSKEEIGSIRLHTDKKLEAYEIYKHFGFREQDFVCMKQYVYDGKFL